MKKNKLHLLDSEYFQLEAHVWKNKELSYEKLLILKEKEIIKRDIAILNYKISENCKKIQNLDKKASNISTSIETIDLAKNKIVANISKRLGLEDSLSWEYDPETLEILI